MPRHGDVSAPQRAEPARPGVEAPVSATPEPLAGAVHCDSCAASCCRLEVLLLSDTGVPDYLTSTDAWGGQVMRRLDDGWCAALDRGTLRCTIYANRPWVCRELQMGGDDCRAIRAEDAAV